MADVTNILYNVTYQTDTTELERVVKVLQQQLAEVNTLNKAIDKLSANIKQAGDKESASFKKVSTELEGLTKKLNKVAAKAKGTLSEVGKGIQSGLGLGGGVAGLAEKATGAIIEMVNESIVLAQQVDAVKGSFEVLGDPELLSSLRDATRNMVSDLQLMKQAVSYSNIGVPIEQMANVMAFANSKASIMGKSVDEVVQGLVDGIGNHSSVALAKLGVDMQDFNSELSKTNDFAEAAFNTIATQAQKASGEVLTVTQKQAQLAAQIQNQQAEVGKTFNELGGYVKSFLADLVSEGNFTLTKNYHKHLQQAEDLAKEHAEVQQKANDLYLNNFEQFAKDYANSDYDGRQKILDQAKSMHDKLETNAKKYYKGSEKELRIYLSGLEMAYQQTQVRLSKTSINPDNFTPDSVSNLRLDQLQELQSEIRKNSGDRSLKTVDKNDRYNALDEAITEAINRIYNRNKGRGNSASTLPADPLRDAIANDDQLRIISNREEQLNIDFQKIYANSNKGGKKLDEDAAGAIDQEYQRRLNELSLRRQKRLVQLQLEYEKEENKIQELNTQKARIDKDLEKHYQLSHIGKIPLRSFAQPLQPPQQLEPIPVSGMQTSNEQAKKEKYNEEERKERLQKTVKAYQDLAAAAVEAYGKISKAQQEALDKEISYREKRVEAARKLAERGNADLLKIEEQRLEEAQKKKDEIARRDATVNAALAASNALVAVTGALATAAKGGEGYTVAARVAIALSAILAALGTGYAFVKSLDTSAAFADGVVDYKGKGGPRDDQNLVRISNGESVITAEGTQRNRALLEAINRGENFSLMGNGLPFVMPQFISPTGSTRYASATNMRNVERKLDGVVAAIEDNRLKQNIFFNEHGVGLMTERAIKKNNRRFK